MVDVEKLSGLSGSKDEDTSINVMEAIKGITQLVQEAKGLQKQFTPQQEQQQQAPAVQVQKAPIQSVQPTPKAEVKATENNLEKMQEYWDKVMQAIDMGILIYGDIPVSEFKAKIEADKPKILTTVRGFMK